jgi:acyl dehydratase
MLDKSFIGLDLGVRCVDIEAGQLKFFAKATGETNPIYFDCEAARAAGHPDIPAPPTFLFCLNSLAPPGVSILQTLGISQGQLLHGEQSFTNERMMYVGDCISLTGRIADLYEKKGGELGFIVLDTDSTNQNHERVATSRNVLVVRNG